MLMVQGEGEQDIEKNLEFPQTTRPFFGLGGHLCKTRMSLLEAKRNLLKLSRKEIFCSQFSLGDTLLVTHDPSPPTTMKCSVC